MYVCSFLIHLWFPIFVIWYMVLFLLVTFADASKLSSLKWKSLSLFVKWMCSTNCAVNHVKQYSQYWWFSFRWAFLCHSTLQEILITSSEWIHKKRIAIFVFICFEQFLQGLYHDSTGHITLLAAINHLLWHNHILLCISKLFRDRQNAVIFTVSSYFHCYTLFNNFNKTFSDHWTTNCSGFLWHQTTNKTPE